MVGSSEARLILICGLPGAGKTTLARQLEAEVPAVRMSGDEWMAELGFDLHDEAARDQMERLFWRLAQELLRLGTSVIMESGFWLRSDRDEKRLGARALGVAVEIHYLDVPLEVRWRRIKQRNEEGVWGSVPITYEQLENWERFFEVPERAELDLFDKPIRESAV